jgi:hypothetical protein
MVAVNEKFIENSRVCERCEFCELEKRHFDFCVLRRNQLPTDIEMAPGLSGPGIVDVSSDSTVPKPMSQHSKYLSNETSFHESRYSIETNQGNPPV